MERQGENQDCEVPDSISGSRQAPYRLPPDDRLRPSADVSYEEGVERAVSAIEDLLRKKDVVLVGIEGAGCNTGKSHLEGSLIGELIQRDVYYGTALDCKPSSIGFALRCMHCLNIRKGVIIVQSMGFGSSMPPRLKGEYLGLVRSNIEQAGFKGIELDLWISIYSPGKQFPLDKRFPDARPLGDIVICNERGREDPMKYKQR